MSDNQIVMIDATDALAFVFIRPRPSDKAGVKIEADTPGMDKRAAAQVLQHIAARWAPPVHDDGQPIIGTTGLRHDQTINDLRAAVAGTAQWAETMAPRQSLLAHQAMTNSYALAAVLGMLLVTDPALAYRAALLVEGIQVDGDVAHLEDLDPAVIAQHAEVCATYAPAWGQGRRTPPQPADAAALIAAVREQVPDPNLSCPTCGSPARHLHPTARPRGLSRAYASLDTGEVEPDTVCMDRWHATPVTPGDEADLRAVQHLRVEAGAVCHDPQCNDSTWDHDCPTPADRA